MKSLNIISFAVLLVKAIDCSNAVAPVIPHHPNKTAIVSRQSRALAFPGSSTVGILLAIAVPLGLPDQEVFLSYNFEANYNSPAAPDYANLGLAGLMDRYGYPNDGGRSGDGQNQTSTLPSKKKSKQKVKKGQNKEKPTKASRTRRFIDRKIVFNVIENKLLSYGFGKACLLRAICEVASIEYGYNNGVFGDIFHILFTPTTSHDDGIDLKYYIAEYNGNSGDCSSYKAECPKSILDFFTSESFSKEKSTYYHLPMPESFSTSISFDPSAQPFIIID